MKRRRHEKHRAPEPECNHGISSSIPAFAAMRNAHLKSRKVKDRSLCWPVGPALVLISMTVCFVFLATNTPKKSTVTIDDSREPFIDTDENTTRILELWDQNNTHLLDIHQFMEKFITSTPNSVSTSHGYLHPRLISAPHRRTHFLPLYEDSMGTSTLYKNRPIRTGETILELPRKFLIWDLDAFRCNFIQQYLFNARHFDTGNALDGGAFLAAFLLYRQKMSTASWRDHPHNTILSHQYRLQYTQEQDDILNRYLQILPYYSTNNHVNESINTSIPPRNQHFHPVLWSDSECLKFLGLDTVSSNLVQAYRHMIISEYHAFNHSSSSFVFNDTGSVFGENISFLEYMQMRLHVMTRSFGTGPPGSEELLNPPPSQTHYKNIGDELEFYKRSTGVDLSKGCRAMSPILDMWDHHASPNADWRYDTSKRAFIIKAAGRHGIQPGYDVWVSYGKYSEAHLFSKFGFVNGDGSGYTESSIAVMHRLLDPGMGQQFSLMSRDATMKLKPLPEDSLIQKKEIVKYLEYDDGYTDCIDPERDANAFALKKLKFQMLSEIANIYDRWVIKWHPRNSSAQPSRGSIIPITSDPPVFDVKRVTFDGSKVLSTCRLITLIHEDYDGDAIAVLKQALKNESVTQSFMVARQNDLSEFRSLNCLVRLTSTALSRYPNTTMDYYNALSSSSLVYGSPEWYASHVALGEMLSLESLRNIALSGARMIVEKLQLRENSNPAAFIRKIPCPSIRSLPFMDQIK